MEIKLNYIIRPKAHQSVRLSKKGFTYSLEYLIKGHKKGYKILEFPALWKERKKGQSRFKIGSWALEYLKLCLIAIIPNFISKKYF